MFRRPPRFTLFPYTTFSQSRGNGERIYQIFQRLFNAQVGVFKLPTAVLPKEKTPWSLVETGAFDLPKSIVEGK